MQRTWSGAMPRATESSPPAVPLRLICCGSKVQAKLAGKGLRARTDQASLPVRWRRAVGARQAMRPSAAFGSRSRRCSESSSASARGQG
eukprot:scaffold495_cov243-Pinguiococcus_pyrenoidosus.AAC.35